MINNLPPRSQPDYDVEFQFSQLADDLSATYRKVAGHADLFKAWADACQAQLKSTFAGSKSDPEIDVCGKAQRYLDLLQIYCNEYGLNFRDPAVRVSIEDEFQLYLEKLKRE